jgi:hypothetical protein
VYEQEQTDTWTLLRPRHHQLPCSSSFDQKSIAKEEEVVSLLLDLHLCSSGPAFAFASVAWQTFEDVDHPSPRPRCAVEASRFISVKVERFILKQHHGTFDETRVKPVKRLEAMGSPDVDEVEANRPCMIPAADAGRLRCLFFALHVSVPHWSVPHKLHEDVPLLYYSPI